MSKNHLSPTRKFANRTLQEVSQRPREVKQQKHSLPGVQQHAAKAATEQMPRAPAAASAGSIREYAKYTRRHWQDKAKDIGANL
jgi:hypothetical protein